LIVCAAGDDEDGEAEEDALAATSIGNRSMVGGGSGHGGDGLRDSVGEEEEEVKRLEVLMCAERKGWSRRRESRVIDKTPTF
jgi:hypothetical protein